MISFHLNGTLQRYAGNKEIKLLTWLRLHKHITSPKDGCSGEGSCGACTVEINGKPRLACRTRMQELKDSEIVTTEGLPEGFRQYIGSIFAKNGAVQCGFCSPGFIMRSKKLFDQKSPPSKEDIIRTINPNLCRCTGYVKIVEAIEEALLDHQRNKFPDLARIPASIGKAFPKYQSIETALGERPFVDDMSFEGMLHGVLKFCKHPRSKIIHINTSEAEALEGVVRIITAKDIPGETSSGLIFSDWPLMIETGKINHCIADVVAGVVARTEAIARRAVELIEVEYEVLNAVTDVHQAIHEESVQVHEKQSNILETCSIGFGDVSRAFKEAAFVSDAVYQTQRVEHAFLETECAIAMPEDEGIRIYSQGQGVYVDRKQISRILGLDETQVKVTQVANGGGFGGKEDLTVQGHAGLFAHITGQPVKVRLNREESLRMHPKRHPVWMHLQLGCTKDGTLTALRLNALGDTGAYASVGTKVMERVVGHATGAYAIPAADIRAKTVYTNNIPSGAMRGFGVPQIIFALESAMDDLCKQGSFDRWQMRFANALEDGSRTATGQRLEGVGLKKTLLAVKEEFQAAKFAGIACGIKNSGVGNGMIDDSEVVIEVVSSRKVLIKHGWTEMGQGIHTMAIQCLHEETGIDPAIMEVLVDTGHGIPTGMTTSSRGTALLGNAIIDAAKRLRKDLLSKKHNQCLDKISGRTYRGKYVCDWTCKPGQGGTDPKIHFAYGYATQVAILDDGGQVKKIIAAHDAGKVINPVLFEGQIQGSVHMGLGYALSENFPLNNGYLVHHKLKDLRIIRAREMPEVKVISVEEKDPHGPYGAKGIGEIGMVPTAAATANAYAAYDGQIRRQLPLNEKNRKNITKS